MQNVNMIFICFCNFNFNKKKKTIGNQKNVVNFLKLVLRVPKTVLRNQKNLIFKNHLKHLKQKCFSVLRQKQSCSHGVENGCTNLQLFSFKPLKPFCLSSEQGLINRSNKKTFISQQTYLHIQVTDILKFYEVLFGTYCKGLLCL